MEFSADQRRAIESRDGALLVSAAAGSGKTRVLTQRLLERVSDPAAPVDLDRFLVITFTRAAAAELRARIMTALGQLAAEHPEHPRYRRQQSLCARADIGTIHSFCTKLLREYSHVLKLSPAFGILEDAQAERLKEAALSRVLEAHYARIDGEPAFRLLADTVGAGQDDQNLADAVQELYEKMCSHPYPERWMAEQKAAFALEGVTDAGETGWGRELLGRAKRQIEFRVGAMERAIAEIYAGDAKIRAAYGPAFSAAADSLRDFCRALEAGWEQARAFSVEFPRLGSLRNYENPDLQERVKKIREDSKKAWESTAKCFDRSSAQLLRELRDCAPAMNALLDLTQEFAAAYGEEKSRQNALDYSDLEHFAVRLLTDAETGAKTWVAAELCRRYEEIMVDEYQDVNAVQEAIFRALSRGENNLFLVGDVKQSIYRFRLADPGLFLKKYRDYAPIASAQPGEARKVLLRENYRSRRGVLDATNLVMGSIMTEALGELCYDEDAALRYGALGYDPALDAPAEFHVIDRSAAAEDGEAEAPGALAAEAQWVARRMLELKQSVRVQDGDGVRPCAWGDFALLLRSPNKTGGAFRQAMEQCGIPVSGQCGSLFASLEVTVVINLLAVIDNPHADVPLISVLRAPIFGFTPDDLSAVRAGERSGDFFRALCAAAERGNEKCADFCRRLEDWRSIAPELSAEDLIRRLCGDTGLFAVCAAMQDGDARRENLLTLIDYARTFAASGGRGLYRFLRWLERKQKKNQEPQSAVGQAVRIMSIHGSKGLEFPVVFLAGLGRKFNDSDNAAPVVIHSRLGLGPRVVDTGLGQVYPTLARRAIQERTKTENRSEEMRLLYVAMTRARERLVMSCTWGNAEKTLEALQQSTPSGRPDPELLRADGTPSHWIARAILANPGTRALTMCVHGAWEPEAAEAAFTPAASAEADPALLAALAARLEFRYPWAGAAELPVKLTATELKGEVPEDPEAEPLLAPETELSFPRAEPGRQPKLTAAERGTATHSFLQYADFGKTGTAEGIRAELERLSGAGFLTAEQAAAIDQGSLLRLFTSPMGQELRGASDLRREFRFLLLDPAEHYFADTGPEDSILLQGVVDCCFVRDGKLTVVDYKTDRVTAAEVPARAERYRGQLRAYSRALERIFGLPVERRVLWFLQPGLAQEV